MRNINQVILIGNLTRDPDMKSSTQTVTTFGIATNREWVTTDGRKQQSSDFHDLVCFGRLAEFAGQTLKKGYLVYVNGHLKTRSWDDESGVKKFRTEIIVEDLSLLEKRQKKTEAHDELQNSYEKIEPSITIENPITI